MLGRVLSAVLDLVLPPSCAGCGAKGAPCCPGCRSALAGTPARRDPVPAPAGLPGCWSAAPYEGVVRATIVAYKERGAVSLAGVLAEAVARTAVTALERTGAARGWAAGGFAVVPVPSARRSLRDRGHDPVGRLAVLAARRLRACGLRAESWAGLRQARRVADQAGLSCAERSANLAGSLQVDRGAKGPPAAFALLLDDIVTTGATLAEAARALRSAGLRVPLAVTASATRRRS
ncbi:Predicted amidophosphoribosyltransferases [Nonomuraea solani]|uniref:Predicted amidophosphoribosyltransferases n=1 Tax=Nonomuraea solani TaxID=1144553 RepID=A0A1H6C0J8_9ACTN|nr:ComF family protein [Nonomuraea solani]SEG66480.1 Predicted amidophosphoribosyltransferases [Nonomuraea solani]